jgi:hypothetical protein
MEHGALSLRAPADHDWPAIAELADEAVEHVRGAPRQHEWVANRRAFRGERMHVVAERRGMVVGYAGLERERGDPEGAYRLFLVTSWTDARDVAELLYGRLEEELVRREARSAWLREYAGDDLVSGFVRERGFEVRERYALGGMEIVTLAKELREPGPVA